MSLLRSKATILAVTPAAGTTVGPSRGIQPNNNDDVKNYEQGFLAVAHVVQAGAGTVDCTVEGSADNTNWFPLFATTQTTGNAQIRNQSQGISQMPPWVRATLTCAGGATATCSVFLLSDGSFTFA